MNMVPDLNRIGSVITAWQRHVVTADEAHRVILTALQSVNLLPECELVPDPEPATASRHAMVILERLEKKITLLLDHDDVLLPDELNPGILSADAKELAGQNRKIEAVSLHRARTGCGFTDAVALINRYLGQRIKPSSDLEIRRRPRTS